MRMSYHILGSMYVGVTVWFGWGGVVSLCRLKHYWSVRVRCGGWGLMAVWNSGFISPGLCSGINIRFTVPKNFMFRYSFKEDFVDHFDRKWRISFAFVFSGAVPILHDVSLDRRV